MTFLTIQNFESYAREHFGATLVPGLFVGGDHPADSAHVNNLTSFDRVHLRPRVLRDVTNRRLSTTVLGHAIGAPIAVAPVGWQRRFHPEGEIATCRAASRAGTLMIHSTAASYSLEDVGAVASGPIWFQLYVLKNRELSADLVRRAETAGFQAIVVTVDNNALAGSARHVGPAKASDARTAVPREMGNFADRGRFPDAPTFATWFESKATDFTWADLAWLRSITQLPIVLKGIQTAEDADLCVAYGVDALVISNHGGYALEGARGTLDVLPEIAGVVNGKVEILLDGGVRRGTDVLKALALGARAVLVGRSAIWGLVAAGESGVHRVLEILSSELDTAMGLIGVTDLTEIDRSYVSQSSV